MNGYNYDRFEYERAYALAKERVEARVGFYWHLASYVVVNAFLIGIYLITNWNDASFGYPWFVWPLAGWGIGLILHAFGVFVFPDTGREQEQRIQRELANMGVTPPYTAPIESKTVTTAPPKQEEMFR
jgi:hypothetical protein